MFYSNDLKTLKYHAGRHVVIEFIIKHWAYFKIFFGPFL